MQQSTDQVEVGIRSILSVPFIYKTYQRIVGIDTVFKKYINEIIRPEANSRILDVGCGEAYILNFLPEDIVYVGYDMSASYIDYAKRKYGSRGTFINERVSEMMIKDVEPFDIVLATGLLHHLNDIEGEQLFKIGYQLLKPGGVMFTYDNAYYEDQSSIARYISSKDRGKHVRYPHEYREIALAAFDKIEVIIRHNMTWIPQTVCILKCFKNI